MREALLGQTARYAPDRAFDTVHVRLDLTVDFARRTVAGRCTTLVRAFRDGVRRLEFDAVNLKVSGVSVDGKGCRHRLGAGTLTVTAPRGLSAGQEASVVVRYRVVKPQAGLHFVHPGPHNPKNPVQVWSQSQPEDARYWYPCHDSPQEKTTSEVRVTVPKGFVAVSNGALVEEAHAGNQSTFHWKMGQPHSIYLISLAAGRFASISEEWEGIPVTYYCERGREEDARRGFQKTVKALEHFSRITGAKYPYEKYAQVAVAEYPGGMEHTTCTTQTDALLIDRRAGIDTDLDFLVAHELAHQWFGDLLTCRDWSHAWLNEGFATYFEILFTEHDKGRDEADYELWTNANLYFDEDSRRYRRPIVSSTYKLPWTLFDRHTYEKGAWVLHMLRAELGEDLWWKSVRHYVAKNRDASVETSDLIAAIAEATGRNLQGFFDQWIYRAGYPNFRVRYSWDQSRRRAGLWVLQRQEGDDSKVFKAPVELRFEGRGWTREFKENLTRKETRWRYFLPGEPLNVEFDPRHLLLKRLDFPKPWRMWAHQLRRAPSGVSRLLAAGPLSRWGDSRTVALLESASRADKFWGAAAEMARALGGIRSGAAADAAARLTRHAHPKVRRAAVSALSQFSENASRPVLERLARRDPSFNVRAEALRGLGALRRPELARTLRRALSERSYRDTVAAGATAGLASIRDPGNVRLLAGLSRPPNGFSVRATALRSLGEYHAVSDQAFTAVAGALDDPDERLAIVAISVLGQLEDERALPALKAASRSANSRIRILAEEALAHVRAGSKAGSK